MSGIKVENKIRNPQLVIVLLNAYDRDLLDEVGNFLAGVAHNGLYKRQYLMKNLPLMVVMQRIMREHPRLRVLVIGNTNRKFTELNQFGELMDRFEGWAHSVMTPNLRYFEDRAEERNIKDKLNTKVNQVRDWILYELEEIN